MTDEIAKRLLDYFDFKFNQNRHKLNKDNASTIILEAVPNNRKYWQTFKNIDEFLVAFVLCFNNFNFIL